MVGRRFRPPIGVLLRLRVRIDDAVEDYTAEARRHPLFELRQLTSTRGGAAALGSAT
jgi:hypothetical protein